MRKSLWTIVAVGALACGFVGMKAHAFADAPLAPGAVAPSFSLPSQEDKQVSLADYKGKFVVLYFYPKDMSSGCTKEAHNFERDKDKYTAANAVVLGVSFDTVESHKTFCTKDSLSFKLLADTDGKVISEYGVPAQARKDQAGNDMKFAARYTYLIGPDGKVAQVWQVKDIDNHSDEVLAAIASAKK
jgi:thioredoxin-dependent peroxiredoxin